MKKLQRLKNNKGFSLVELLIVIAIMAVLVGILAPQYIRYVERSRMSSDVQVVNSINTAVKTTSVDPLYELEMSNITEIVVTWNTTSGAISVTTTPATNQAAINTAITDIVESTVTPRSNGVGNGANVVITFEVDSTTGSANIDEITGGNTDFLRMLRNLWTP
ncbi:MAG: prepilin-type N-terminal cleavage/methylation domain-containing protein [Oscillospiraceae bacterium]|nr:prepilin-type N-terminal cleavage/methylation domain-containing protein [Oscillospiraceae bacterium]